MQGIPVHVGVEFHHGNPILKDACVQRAESRLSKLGAQLEIKYAASPLDSRISKSCTEFLKNMVGIKKAV